MITIAPSTLKGEIKIQPSKSVSHRSVICAALAKGESVIKNIALSDDIAATLNAVRDMGLCGFEVKGDVCRVFNAETCGKDEIFCNESGSTLRFLLPLGMDGRERRYTGRGRLLSRPQQPYEELCRKNGIFFKRGEGGITVRGTLKSGVYAMPGDISSQFATGLMLALPLKSGESKIAFTTEIESRGYIELTIDIQRKFGVKTYFENGELIIPGGQCYTPCETVIEGDFSHAAFFAVGAALSGEADIKGLSAASKQGDRAVFDILSKMGADINGFRVKKAPLRGIDIDASQIPDLVPALCVAACGAVGKTRIYNAARLRIKESDRLAAMAQELKKLGANVKELADGLEISGKGYLTGGETDAHNDHRVAMAMAVASCIAKENITINGSESVKKSAPAFYEEFKSLGGIVL